MLVLLWCSLSLHGALLQIYGSVERPLSIDAETFSQLPQTTLKDVALVCRSGEVKAPPKALTGVLLRDLLEHAGLKAPGHGGRNRLVVLASGTDGYGAAFSYHELFNSRTGEGVLIVEEAGGFGLYSRHDYVTGPRHVRDLETLCVSILGTTPINSKGQP
jgi:hypothetical protein